MLYWSLKWQYILVWYLGGSRVKEFLKDCVLCGEVVVTQGRSAGFGQGTGKVSLVTLDGGHWTQVLGKDRGD